MANVEKSLEKFKRSLANGTYYEAQQLIKTVYHRLRSRKLLEESRDLLEKASCLQLEHAQVTCATELANVLLQSYKDDGLKADETAISRILRILASYEASNSGSATEFCSVANAAIKWAHNTDARSDTASTLQAMMGQYIWTRQGLNSLQLAAQHFSRSSDMASFAKALAGATTHLEEGEEELLSIRAVLLVLNVPSRSPVVNLGLANILVPALLRESCLPKDSLGANFLTLLLEALQRKSLGLVHLLQRSYSKLLERDPVIGSEMQVIQTTYCGARPLGGGGFGNLLGGMFRSLMAGEQ